MNEEKLNSENTPGSDTVAPLIISSASTSENCDMGEDGNSSDKKKTVTRKSSKKTKKTNKKVAPKDDSPSLPPQSDADVEIGNDLYNLYVESKERARSSYASINIFDAIENEIVSTPEEENYPQNTAYDMPDEEEQLSFSSEIDDDSPEDREDVDEEEKTLPPFNPKKPRSIDNRFDFLELFIFTLLAVMILTSFVFRHSIVEGDSMQNTLQTGEHLIISDLFYNPDRGDIVVCEDYTTGLRKPIVKRVIAVEGDLIEIKADGSIYVNDKLLDEDYTYVNADNYRYNPMKLRVPENEIFVMGDHRNASTDSRDFGCVSEDAILGRVLIRFYPFDKFGTVE